MSTTIAGSPVVAYARHQYVESLDGYRRSGRLWWQRDSRGLRLIHPFAPDDISDSTVVSALSQLVEERAIAGQDEFEDAAVALITSVHSDARTAWRAFYANSVAELGTGNAAFSPVHRRARSLLTGESVLEIGCCFGFFALQCAADGRTVTAVDICAGALELLDDASRHLSLPVDTRLGDVRDLPFPDRSFDTVTVLHLLEHLDPQDVSRAIDEACRVARRRVVIAVPYEEQASPHFGHLSTITDGDLRQWAAAAPGRTTQVFADHGGWLVIDM